MAGHGCQLDELRSQRWGSSRSTPLVSLGGRLVRDLIVCNASSKKAALDNGATWSASDASSSKLKARRGFVARPRRGFEMWPRGLAMMVLSAHGAPLSRAGGVAGPPRLLSCAPGVWLAFCLAHRGAAGPLLLVVVPSAVTWPLALRLARFFRSGCRGSPF